MMAVNLVHQGWRGMLYQNIDSVRDALTDNRDTVKGIFSELLAGYSGASKSDVSENAGNLFDRAVGNNSHPVYAVDALEVLLPALTR